jgi:hypothetical protein
MWEVQVIHIDAWYDAYLRWFLPHTHPYVTHVAQDDEEQQQRASAVVDTYPIHRNQAHRGVICHS